ncbi:flagellar protein FliT [Bacillus chungangensis]|uniref:Flagellar protein FliT n=1 Tax=Bacillus chungangensis TaxID=587633 RepID=A0ABT9WWG0_9BACI|nr:flagellar protein FliT [Bacillus chungangensis]MDQ0177075.1 flagellar protein FliT [Bacillus chungangensis]
MTAVKECYETTEQLLALTQAATKEKRDEQIEQIDRLLAKREQLLPSIQPPYTEEEKKLGREMVEKNKLIDSLLQQIYQSIQRDMNGLEKEKVSVKKYANPYENLQTASVFYDKRN